MVKDGGTTLPRPQVIMGLSLRILWCESNYYNFSFYICLVCYQTCGAGLKRSGRSCRSRWMNYLCPNVKHGEFSEEEEELIIRLHNLLGNRSPLPLPSFLFLVLTYYLKFCKLAPNAVPNASCYIPMQTQWANPIRPWPTTCRTQRSLESWFLFYFLNQLWLGLA